MFLSMKFVHLTEIDFSPALYYNVLNKIDINLKRLLSYKVVRVGLTVDSPNQNNTQSKHTSLI